MVHRVVDAPSKLRNISLVCMVLSIAARPGASQVALLAWKESTKDGVQVGVDKSCSRGIARCSSFDKQRKL